MAVMQRMPDTGTIVAMRHRVDFYYWKGIPVARAWPRKSTQPRSEGEILSSDRFTAYTKMTGAIDENVRAAYKDFMADAKGVTWVDAFRAQVGNRGWVTFPTSNPPPWGTF